MAVVRDARKAGAQYVGREPSLWTFKDPKADVVHLCKEVRNQQ